MSNRATDVDRTAARLRLARGHVGDVAGDGLFLVVGFNGENIIRAVGRTQTEAWRRAAEQADSLGMYGRSFW